MADHLGKSPNLIDDVFKELERMEDILGSIPDLEVDDLDDGFSVHDPSDLTPDI